MGGREKPRDLETLAPKWQPEKYILLDCFGFDLYDFSHPCPLLVVTSGLGLTQQPWRSARPSSVCASVGSPLADHTPWKTVLVLGLPRRTLPRLCVVSIAPLSTNSGTKEEDLNRRGWAGKAERFQNPCAKMADGEIHSVSVGIIWV